MERIRGRHAQAAWQRYVLPVGIAIVALLLIVSFFSRGGNAGAAKSGSYVEAAPTSQDSSVKIVYAGSNEAVIDKSEKVYVGEKIVSDKGTASVMVPGSSSTYRLKERGRLRFLGSDYGPYKFQLENSELWINEKIGAAVFQMSFLTVTPDAGSVVNVFQNQVASTVYVLAGSAMVAGKAGSGTVSAGYKVTMLSSDAATVDPAAKQELIDDAFRSSAWFTSNGGNVAMASGFSATATGSKVPTYSGEAGFGPAAVTFNDISDELTVEKSPLTVTGTSPRASKVSLGGVTAVVDPATRKFTIPGVVLTEGANDLVWKALDAEGATLAKGVVTVYLPKKKASALPNKVVSYPISDKDYKIVAPAGNPFTTSEDFVQIKGEVPAGVVDRITVNDYQLKTSFRPGGTSWYYFANKGYGTLGDGLNLYKIRYFAADGKVLLESLFTIVSEPAKAVSGEAKAAN